MKTFSKLSLLALLITLASCNEKVSPDVQDNSATTGGATGGGTTGGGSGPTIVPPEYYFKLTSKTPINFNYKLHKTGVGNYNKDCEIKTPNAFDNSFFIANPTVYDVTCYLDAEELALSLGGLSLQIESSPNTCDAVAYTPFSYYNRLPGNSSGTYTKINCTTPDTTPAHVITAAFTAGVNLATSGAPATCDQYIAASIPAAARQAFNTPESEDHLCRFKYRDLGKENCDVGEITINEFQVTYDPSVADAAGVSAGNLAAAPLIANYTDTIDDGLGTDDGLATISPAEQAAIDAAYMAAYSAAYAAYQPTSKLATRTVKCGGKVSNCVDGPIKTHAEIGSYTSGTYFNYTEFDQTYSKKWEYPALAADRRRDNYFFANFRRNLANANIDYGTLPGSGAYTSAFSPLVSSSNASTFDPRVMANYAANMSITADQLVDPTSTSMIYENNTYYAKKLAADPFMGLGGYVHPFYEFVCYDNAWDMKSRIRLVVREWDRTVPVNATMELISDIFNGSTARQDNSTIEIPYNVPFNDAWDWDDIIPMVRQSAPFIYHEPYLGYGDPDLFPQYSKEQ